MRSREARRREQRVKGTWIGRRSKDWKEELGTDWKELITDWNELNTNGNEELNTDWNKELIL